MQMIRFWHVAACACALAVVVAGCGDEHAVFAEHVTSHQTTNVTRYRGAYVSRTTAADGDVVVADSICVVDYVRAADSQTGDSIIMHYLHTTNGAAAVRRLTVDDIGQLNGSLRLRHDQRTLFYVVDATGDRRQTVARSLDGTLDDQRLRFWLVTDDFTLEYDGVCAIHTAEQ